VSNIDVQHCQHIVKLTAMHFVCRLFVQNIHLYVLLLQYFTVGLSFLTASNNLLSAMPWMPLPSKVTEG